MERWRARKNETFYFVNEWLETSWYKECGSEYCNCMFESGNYFMTSDEAERFAKVTRSVFKKNDETNTEKSYYEQLREEIEESHGWMKDSVLQHPGSIDEITRELDSLAEDCGDCYEVFVALYLTNGNVISLRNKCVESYIENDYRGDDLYFPHGMNDILYVEFNDTKGNYNQMRIPISSICFLDQWNEFIDWKSEKDHIIEEIKKINPEIK